MNSVAPHSWLKTVSLAAVLSATAWLGGTLSAQPESKQPPGAPAPADDAGRERLRQNLTAHLERLGRVEQNVQEGLRMLDAGEPVSRVREFTRDAFVNEAMDAAQGRAGAGGPLAGRFRERMARNAAAGEQDAAAGPEPVNIDTALEIIKEANPELHARLARLRAESPEDFQKLLDRNMPRIKELAGQRRMDPEGFPDRLRVFVLQREAQKLARDIARTPEAERGPQMDLLRAKMTEAFELRLTIARADEARLLARLERLREEIREKSDGREQAIDARIEQMIRMAGRPDEMPPEPPAPAAPAQP
jgi:hypothetical protein